MNHVVFTPRSTLERIRAGITPSQWEIIQHIAHYIFERNCQPARITIDSIASMSNANRKLVMKTLDAADTAKLINYTINREICLTPLAISIFKGETE